MSRPSLLLSSLLVLLPAGGSTAEARDGGGSRHGRAEARIQGTCGHGASSELRLKSDRGVIELEYRVRHSRRGAAWQVVIAQEGHVAWRGRARTSRSSGSLTVKRELRDLAGADRIAVRGLGPGGVSCLAAATLQG